MVNLVDAAVREDYFRRVGLFCSGMNRLKPKGVGLLLYLPLDSHVNPFESLDGAVVLPGGVVTDSTLVQEVSILLADSFADTSIDPRLDVVDVATLGDGRFNYFNPFFDLGVSRPSSVVGRDYRSGLRYSTPVNYAQKLLRDNLRISRKGLLLSEYHKRRDNDAALFSGFRFSDDSAFHAPSLLVQMDESYVPGSSLARTVDLFLTLDYLDREGVYELYARDPNGFTQLWSSAVNAFEITLDDYVRKNPSLPSVDVEVAGPDVAVSSDDIFADL